MPALHKTTWAERASWREHYDKGGTLSQNVGMALITDADAADRAYRSAVRLGFALWEKHWQATSPQWRPLDDLEGVIDQIDHMTVGLVRSYAPEF